MYQPEQLAGLNKVTIFRDRILNALERGERPTDIAARFGVSRVWVYQVRDRFYKEGKRGPLQVGGYRRSRVAHMEQTLRVDQGTSRSEAGGNVRASVRTRHSDQSSSFVASAEQMGAEL
ncbi:helix-turn-helix domain-containing protein [Nitrosomonas eutropha]|uniref:helix-turn-helix domain-containing protein n=1 Tax=Nitrosomonas eutropha TaxID=916 RepID=UPI000943CDB1|nr:helix-turn-helix domain-containing protein [Nitrosomonas eutropha]